MHGKVDKLNMVTSKEHVPTETNIEKKKLQLNPVQSGFNHWMEEWFDIEGSREVTNEGGKESMEKNNKEGWKE